MAEDVAFTKILKQQKSCLTASSFSSPSCSFKKSNAVIAKTVTLKKDRPAKPLSTFNSNENAQLYSIWGLITQKCSHYRSKKLDRKLILHLPRVPGSCSYRKQNTVAAQSNSRNLIMNLRESFRNSKLLYFPGTNKYDQWRMKCTVFTQQRKTNLIRSLDNSAKVCCRGTNEFWQGNLVNASDFIMLDNKQNSDRLQMRIRNSKSEIAILKFRWSSSHFNSLLLDQRTTVHNDVFSYAYFISRLLDEFLCQFCLFDSSLLWYNDYHSYQIPSWEKLQTCN